MKDILIFSGKVIRGENLGKKLSFPTANIDRREFKKLSKKPKLGIYSGYVILPNKKKNKAALIIGPLDKKGLPKLEAHLINFSGNLYGKKLTFALGQFLRHFKKYSDQKELIRQIKEDIKKIH